MLSAIREDIGRVCDRFTRDRAIQVTPAARDLIAMTIGAIVEDPHPSWQTDRPADFVRIYVEDTYAYLGEIANAPSISSNTISAFDFLFWLSADRNLQLWLSTIPKRDDWR